MCPWDINWMKLWVFLPHNNVEWLRLSCSLSPRSKSLHFFFLKRGKEYFDGINRFNGSYRLLAQILLPWFNKYQQLFIESDKNIPHDQKGCTFEGFYELKSYKTAWNDLTNGTILIRAWNVGIFFPLAFDSLFFFFFCKKLHRGNKLDVSTRLKPGVVGATIDPRGAN